MNAWMKLIQHQHNLLGFAWSDDDALRLIEELLFCT